MNINCFKNPIKTFKFYKNEVSSNLNNFAEWQDPEGDKLILAVSSQVCRFEN